MADASQQRHCIPATQQVEARTGLSRSTIYARVKVGTFPAPVSLGPRAVGWTEFRRIYPGEERPEEKEAVWEKMVLDKGSCV